MGENVCKSEDSLGERTSQKSKKGASGAPASEIQMVTWTRERGIRIEKALGFAGEGLGGIIRKQSCSLA